MVGQPSGFQQLDQPTSDWVNKASPEQLYAAGAAVLSKIGQMDTTSQDRFVRQIQNEPTASRLFERIGQATT